MIAVVTATMSVAKPARRHPPGEAARKPAAMPGDQQSSDEDERGGTEDEPRATGRNMSAGRMPRA